MMSKSISFFYGSVILTILVACFAYTSYQANGSHFIYTLDDAYIHLAISENLANNGTWGINSGEFAPASSSILYTFLLSFAIKIFGSHYILPFIINLLGAFGLMYVFIKSSGDYFKDVKNNTLRLSGYLLAVILFIPLVPLIFTGMEHVFQMLINLLFVWLWSYYFFDKEKIKPVQFGILLLLAALVSMIRFEGLFLIGSVALFLMFQKRWRKAFALLFAGVLPVIVFGLYSMSKGSFFLPNSIIMKGEKPDTFSLAGLMHYLFEWLNKLKDAEHVGIFMLVLLLFFLYRLQKTFFVKDKQLAVVFVILLTTLAHLTFAQTGWFYRYEAYLVLLSIWAIAAFRQELSGIITYIRNKLRNITAINFYAAATALLILLVIFLSPMVYRGLKAHQETVQATNNIYEQQYQMARFINEYYANTPIAANDIGALAYFNDNYLLDLYGLGNTEVISLKIKGKYDDKAINRIATEYDVKIAVIYDQWFEERIPDKWVKCGEWVITDNIICAFDDVSFYAVDPAHSEALMKNLRAFSDSLPADIIQKGPYLSSPVSSDSL